MPTLHMYMASSVHGGIVAACGRDDPQDEFTRVWGKVTCPACHAMSPSAISDVKTAAKAPDMPDIIPMLLWCPECKARHVDVGVFATKPHHTHACQGCGHVWRPAIVPTCGVQFLPGFKNKE